MKRPTLLAPLLALLAILATSPSWAVMKSVTYEGEIDWMDAAVTPDAWTDVSVGDAVTITVSWETSLIPSNGGYVGTGAYVYMPGVPGNITWSIGDNHSFTLLDEYGWDSPANNPYTLFRFDELYSFNALLSQAGEWSVNLIGRESTGIVISGENKEAGYVDFMGATMPWQVVSATSEVPVPAAFPLFLSALLGLGAVARRR